MLSKLKSLPVMAAMAGGMLVASTLAPTASRAADCPTVDIAALFVVGTEYLCGDKKYYEFTSQDFTTDGSAVFSQSPDGTIHDLTFTDFLTPLGVGTYTVNFKVDVLSSQMIVSETSSVLPSGSGSSSLTLTSSPNPYEFTGVLEVTDPMSMVSDWQLTITQTPGPLPILGAGAAFGFSRKLRRRIKVVG